MKKAELESSAKKTGQEVKETTSKKTDVKAAKNDDKACSVCDTLKLHELP